ncbi:MAG: 4Fe-4S dicluster domain-containing protein [Proteobacteria bacterium]|nr:4Fe-4S dicluster domain-containing protein [Pseudomonadota bacterium]MBU1650089.1 4Fe-4S dicluster domain-containing protein [Pseudomonadota bacterium]
MNDRYILSKAHLKSFLRKVKKNHRIVAPVTNQHGDTLFCTISHLDRVEVNLSEQALNSIKPFLFPQQDILCTYTVDEDGYRFTENDAPPEPTVYLGVRPCDLMAVLYTDVIFMGGTKDKNYRARRQDSILIGLNCNDPFPNCFCNATKSGPFLEYGYDLLLTDLGERYLVEVGRPRGREMLQDWIQFFTPAEEEDTRQQYQLSLEAMAKFRLNVHADQAISRLQAGLVPEGVWEELSLRCQDCAGCAYVCPTCTCFTISDRKTDKQSGVRLRSWDACTFGGFTRMAGGHNPVNPRTGAIRQRFMHKLNYDVTQYGRPSCVGCGRCVGICFGGVDIVRFIGMAGED